MNRMVFSVVAAVAMLCSLTPLSAQDNHTLFPIEIGSKWGYIDFDGKVVIPAIFDAASKFSDNGLACAKMGGGDAGKWGYIRPDGSTAIAFDYDDADGFSEGLARIHKDEKWGFIDST
jgi:hypothetical protein